MKIIPSNGNPHNQIAVLATYLEDEMEAIYRYYRSLTVSSPFLTAKENIRVLFEKNRKKYDLLPKNIFLLTRKSLNSSFFLLSFPFYDFALEIMLKFSQKEGNKQQIEEYFKYFQIGFVRIHGILLNIDEFHQDEFSTLKSGIIELFDKLLKKNGIPEKLIEKCILMNIFLFEFHFSKETEYLFPELKNQFKFKLNLLSNFLVEFISPLITRAARCNNYLPLLSSFSFFLQWIFLSSSPSPFLILSPLSPSLSLSFSKFSVLFLNNILSSSLFSSPSPLPSVSSLPPAPVTSPPIPCSLLFLFPLFPTPLPLLLSSHFPFPYYYRSRFPLYFPFL